MSTLEVTLPEPAGTMTPAWHVIERVERETADTFTIHLSAVDGGFSFGPGQFNMLYAPGYGEVPISISGDPTHQETIVHTIRAVGAVTRALWRLKRGDVVGLRGPFGVPWPVDDARGRDLLVMAGGIGLAPLRPVLYAVDADREAFGRVSLLYGARSPEDLLYVDEWFAAPPPLGVDVHVTVDRATHMWSGAVGVVTSLVQSAQFDPARAIAMICGPEVMMRFSVSTLRAAGVTDERIFLSMERNMKCGVGLCGHCQCGPYFICRDGPVFRCDRIGPLMNVREL